jgi:hypothetical protein
VRTRRKEEKYKRRCVKEGRSCESINFELILEL